MKVHITPEVREGEAPAEPPLDRCRTRLGGSLALPQYILSNAQLFLSRYAQCFANSRSRQRRLADPCVTGATGILFSIILASAVVANAALPTEWAKTQTFDITTNGLVKLDLPTSTLDAARPALQDLRLCDDGGREVPFLIEHPQPVQKAAYPPKSFVVSLTPTTTVIQLETGLAQALNGVTLETPAPNFIKGVSVEGSADGATWQPLARGAPVFRTLRGAAHLDVTLPAGAWRWLRLTVDDQRSDPVPFTGARVHAAATEAIPSEVETATITARDENPGETRLTLDLGAALDIAAVHIDTTESLFTRAVTVAIPHVFEDAIQEQIIGRGTIYRVGVEGQAASENLSVPLGIEVRSREVILLIRNDDSPPLPISSVSIERRPVHLVFMARQQGRFTLLTGNAHCAAPRYDLSSLGLNLKSIPVTPTKFSPPAPNPDFRAPEALAGLEFGGAPLDAADWHFRKSIHVTESGAAQFDADLDILARAAPDFADLRILRGTNQIPYIVERTSIRRALTPEVTITNDTPNPHLSRWIIKLPRAGLPISTLACVPKTPLFRRDFTLYETLADGVGNQYQHALADASWTQTPERKPAQFQLALNETPRGDTLVLETENGDNPPIELDKFAAHYPAARILFKAKANDELSVYYGNPRASAPSYDLSLVAAQLLAANKTTATLSPEEQLKKASWTQSQTGGQGGIMLWSILAVVVVALLAIIMRLLPKLQPPSA